jgi:hypothetical protein
VRIVDADVIEVNGLSLPPQLVRALSDGRWSRLSSSVVLAAAFGAEPVRPRFHSMAGIISVNEYWKGEVDPLYVGEANPSQYPGDIDPKRSLIVAELGPDQLIALDYRRSIDPEVLFASDDPRSPWRLIYRSVAELLASLAVSD